MSKLYALSWREAKQFANGNWSGYAYAGIPLLISATHAFIVEYENMLRPNVGFQQSIPLDTILERQYGVTGSLLEDFKDLIELRNELAHPAHLPPGTPDNWPESLRRVKALGLLNSTGRSDGDYDLLGQIASFRLFIWAADVVKQVSHTIVNSDPKRAPQFKGFLSNFEDPWFPASDSDEGMSVLLRLV